MNQVATNVRWHHAAVGPEERAQRLGQRGVVVWLTGLSGAGKSTIAAQVDAQLHARGRHSYILDGDNLRFGLCRDLGFSPEDRAENVRRLGEAARLLQDAGLIVLVAAISPYRDDRARVRERLPAGRFLEVFVDAPLAVCESRDPKGLYRRARAGEIAGFSGIDAPYEPPEAPDLHLLFRADASSPDAPVDASPAHAEHGPGGVGERRVAVGASPDEHAAAIVALLEVRGLLAPPAGA
ncbi:adenylylsulfate kinase [Nannocystis exedens]|uniref:Adenylyl-sulfate kinase n=1 Tax=Nannocystis exedens TaxID=54 RepID=A0A1I1TFR9_9BACT|nr:adenylyl-sulfate kinase [Nannocystis exedens]PCC66591.1 adenylyl-sulfate kinase [Nannocystis exedens]SFD57429.1 adenylylsulfate kinase [Nannocystis exedens]